MKFCPLCDQEYSEAQRFCEKEGGMLSLRDPYKLVGCTLADKYRIDALISTGGMGAIYAAHHLDFDYRVAFKILKPDLAIGRQREEMVRLFAKEGKTAIRLTHNNIIRVMDAGRVLVNDSKRSLGEISYIVMEWLEGRTLEEELEMHGPLSFERMLEILRQIAAALDEAHASSIIHRDLKPSNVMIVKRPDGQEQIKVLDFGIAKVLSATGPAQVSREVGTPHYACPEQWQRGSDIDARADIYALGIMLFELLTGAYPFNAVDLRELIQLHLTAAPPPLRDYRPNAPILVEQLLNRMLEKDPDQRPQTAGEVLETFQHALLNPLDHQKDTPPVKSSEFKVVSLDVRGKVTEERNGSAQHFSEYLGGGVKIEMVEIPEGSFLMGSPHTEKERFGNESPQHRVEVSAFRMGKYSVTQAQWGIVAGLPKVTLDLPPSPAHFKGSDLPVESVSWEEAVEFCERLKRKTGREYCLPTETQWEHACRAGADTPFAFGETITPEIVNYDGNFPYGLVAEGLSRKKTVAVGSLGVANRFGLSDMHGNVWEWCQDWFHSYPSEGATDPPGPQGTPSGQYRVLRGGSWNDAGRFCRAASRGWQAPTTRKSNVGFRVAISPLS